MSTYCTQSDIEGEIQDADLIACTDDVQQGVIDTTVLNQVISNASEMVDRYVGAVYQVPFNPVPVSVNSMTIIIACYRLLRRREVPDEKNKFYEDYKDVVKFLKQVQMRDVPLDLSATQAFSQVQVDIRPTIFGFGNVIANSM